MIEVEVEDDAWREIADVEAVATQAAEAALYQRLRLTAGVSDPPPLGKGDSAQQGGGGGGGSRRPLQSASPTVPPEGEHLNAAEEESETVTILLTGDAEVRELNARFRGKDAATNVLSFPAAPSAAPFLGDIALAHGVCAGEALAQGKSLAHHLSHLVVHGVLHLLGYDHAADAEAEVMEDMERAVLAKLGVQDPYRSDGAHVGP